MCVYTVASIYKAHLCFYMLYISWKEYKVEGWKEGVSLLTTLTWLYYSFVFNNMALLFYYLYQYDIIILKNSCPGRQKL